MKKRFFSKFCMYKSTILKYKENDKNEETFEKCSKFLHQGGLVAFPTETVYGLGANALNSDAVHSIFKAKQRPLTDPVIVHVLNFEQALPLIEITQKQEKVYQFLTEEFWPGPLTIVTKANLKIIPECVTAKTGFLGIRSPKHKVARELIEKSNLPIAAPSANRFGHVSPTNAQHVYDDLNDCGLPILIIDSEEKCEIGIESTVAKLEEHEEIIYVTILRRGGISLDQLENSVKKLKEKVIVSTQIKKVSMNTVIGQEAPGQLITHYAPDIPAYLYDLSEDDLKEDEKTFKFDQCVMIDFGKKMEWTKDQVLKYFDLSPNGNILEGANNLFDILRKSEKCENAKVILLPNIENIKDEHTLALFDRIFRAASGQYSKVSKNKIIKLN